MRPRGDGKVFVLSSYFLGRCAHSWEVRCQKKQEQACSRQVPSPQRMHIYVISVGVK